MSRSQIFEHFYLVCRRPGMFVQSASFAAVCSYMHGFDTALSGGALVGFREWLLLRGSEWNNMPWWGIVRQQVLGSFMPSDPIAPPEDERLRDELARLLEEFSKAQAAGLDSIFYQYGVWLLAQGRTFEDS
ncbi:MAG: hypothetical protein OEZ06_31405 [Myxococcales bacterium]|nr:hypothetical protein [Myxococcales bacterium]